MPYERPLLVVRNMLGERTRESAVRAPRAWSQLRTRSFRSRVVVTRARMLSEGPALLFALARAFALDRPAPRIIALSVDAQLPAHCALLASFLALSDPTPQAL